MRLGAFLFHLQEALLTDKLNLPLRIVKEKTIEKMLEACGACLLKNVKSGIWIADLQLVRCPTCNVNTCEVDIVAATLGCLNHILEMRKISVHQVSYLVLDKVERILNMGFEPHIRKNCKAGASSSPDPHVHSSICGVLLRGVMSKRVEI